MIERQSYWPPPGCVSMMRNTFGARRMSSAASVHEANSTKDGVKVFIHLATNVGFASRLFWTCFRQRYQTGNHRIPNQRLRSQARRILGSYLKFQDL